MQLSQLCLTKYPLFDVSPVKHEFNSTYSYKPSLYISVNAFTKQTCILSYFSTAILLAFLIVILSFVCPISSTQISTFPLSRQPKQAVDKRRETTLRNNMKQPKGN